MGRKKKEETKQAKPQKYFYTIEQWKEIATCPVCNVLLERDEPYKIGWTKPSESGGLLSIRGHKECWYKFYNNKGD